MICRRVTYFADLKWLNTTKKREAEIASLRKLKAMWQIMPDRLLKKSFLMVYVGIYDCYENIKMKLWSTISILKPWH